MLTATVGVKSWGWKWSKIDRQTGQCFMITADEQIFYTTTLDKSPWCSSQIFLYQALGPGRQGPGWLGRQRQRKGRERQSLGRWGQRRPTELCMSHAACDLKCSRSLFQIIYMKKIVIFGRFLTKIDLRLLTSFKATWLKTRFFLRNYRTLTHSIKIQFWWGNERPVQTV